MQNLIKFVFYRLTQIMSKLYTMEKNTPSLSNNDGEKEKRTYKKRKISTAAKYITTLSELTEKMYVDVETELETESTKRRLKFEKEFDTKLAEMKKTHEIEKNHLKSDFDTRKNNLIETEKRMLLDYKQNNERNDVMIKAMKADFEAQLQDYETTIGELTNKCDRYTLRINELRQSIECRVV